METRIVKTEFWKDKKVHTMSKNARFLFIYIITCPHIGKTGIFELSDDYILLETGLSEKDLSQSKKELEDQKRIFFKDGWIFVLNAIKHNRYNIGEKTAVGYKREYESLPKNIVEYYNNLNNSSINDKDTTIANSDSTNEKYINNKYKYINNNINTENNYNKENTEQLPQKKEKEYKSVDDLNEEVLQEIATKEGVDMSFVLNVKEKMVNWLQAKGKRYKNYKAGLSNWVKGTIERQNGFNKNSVTQI